jgi:hypothetical protein
MRSFFFNYSYTSIATCPSQPNPTCGTEQEIYLFISMSTCLDKPSMSITTAESSTEMLVLLREPIQQLCHPFPWFHGVFSTPLILDYSSVLSVARLLCAAPCRPRFRTYRCSHSSLLEPRFVLLQIIPLDGMCLNRCNEVLGCNNQQANSEPRPSFLPSNPPTSHRVMWSSIT